MKDKKKDILVIPDIHGRSFWREAVTAHGECQVVFLGDYLDPYGSEGITPSMAFTELKDIVEFKKKNMDRVVLLLGNHDLGYLNEEVCRCRHDYYGENRNRRFLLDNLDLFDLTYETAVGNRRVLFSHAGIREMWVNSNDWLFGEVEFTPSLLNRMFHHPSLREDLMSALSQVSFYRGGRDLVGSPVWADMDEFIDMGDFLPGYLQVFGHSLHSRGPVLIRGEETEGWCLDCMEAFLLDENCGIRYAVEEMPEQENSISDIEAISGS